MALVLRKAVLPKNLSLLKCMKGRPLASATNRTNATAITTAVPSRRSNVQKTVQVNAYKIVKAKLPTKVDGNCIRSKTSRIHGCMSCPNFETTARIQDTSTNSKSSLCGLNSPKTGCIIQKNYYSTITTRSQTTLGVPVIFSVTAMAHSPLNCNVTRHNPDVLKTSRRSFAKAPPCSPCCGCGCGCCSLPPPCNTPPKCIQFMTGYYYYPYGFWFCGPYHVTGTCTPIGPACPGGPCGPCAPCPSCQCAKCCACLSPAISAVAGSPAISSSDSLATKTTSFQQPLPKLIDNSSDKCSMTPPAPKENAMGTVQMSFRPLAPSPVKTDVVQDSGVVPDTPVTIKKSKSVISKFFPFTPDKGVQNENIQAMTKCMMCPFAPSMNNSASIAKPLGSSLTNKDPNKSNVSTSFKRSLTYYEQASLKSKYTKAAK